MQKLSKTFLIQLCLISITYISIFVFNLAKLNWNITGFIDVGREFRNPKLTEGFLIKSKWGYDAQFYFYIAHDILARDDEIKMFIDNPPYRYQRIFYPLVVRTLAFGENVLFPYAMFFSLFLSIVVGFVFFRGVLSTFGLERWAFLYAFAPGFYFSFKKFLPEPMAIALFIGGLHFGLRGNRGIKSKLAEVLMFSASCLTREQMIPAVLIYTALSRRFHVLLSLLPFFAWQFYLFYVFGVFPLTEGKGNISFPFFGIAALFEEIPLSRVYRNPFLFSVLFVLFIVISTAVIVFRARDWWRRYPENLFLSLSLFYSLFTLSLSEKVWVLPPYSFPRVSSEFFIFSLPLLLMTERKLAVFGTIGLFIISRL